MRQRARRRRIAPYRQHSKPAQPRAARNRLAPAARIEVAGSRGAGPHSYRKNLTMMIDVFPHIIPAKYKQALYRLTSSGYRLQDVIETVPSMFELDQRFRIAASP